MPHRMRFPKHNLHLRVPFLVFICLLVSMIMFMIVLNAHVHVHSRAQWPCSCSFSCSMPMFMFISVLNAMFIFMLNAHVRFWFFNWVFKLPFIFSNIQSSNNLRLFKIYKFTNSKNSKIQKASYANLPTCSEFRILRYEKLLLFKNVPIFSCIFEIFWW